MDVADEAISGAIIWLIDTMISAVAASGVKTTRAQREHKLLLELDADLTPTTRDEY
jgi:tmRNA-binding protein